MKVCGAHPLTFTKDDTLSAGNVSSHFIRFFKLMYEMDFRLLLFPLMSVIFHYSQLVSAFYFTCKTVINYSFMGFLLFRLRFLCLTFKMNHNTLFILTKITVPVCNTI